MSIIDFQSVTKRFGDVTILDKITLSIDKGEIVVVIGPSGSGKSTFLRCINALETINEGDLLVDGTSVKGTPSDIRRIRREAGMVFQQFNLFPNLTALENVAFGARKVRGMHKKEAFELAESLLEKVHLADRKDNYPNQLSGGQQQRVAIARSLALKPQVMLFDEPTSALDPELRQEVLHVMQEVAQEGMTMVVVTHEMNFARDVGTRLLFIEKGHIVVDDDPKKVFENPDNPRLREFLSCVE
ncbi:glutamine ABC transporter ATP-binding protein GlnQ [Bifidobacterium sp. 82T25]|nr:glutamine ABC transporter ATP-binding protein GlnQ [Bifidobacterium miconisargentati]MBW3089558.1 glutamine ABC transporter ATP-binding protein GlnQ [Bifidobacterium miconisargentati]